MPSDDAGEKAILEELKRRMHAALRKRLEVKDRPLLTLAASFDVRWKGTDFVFKKEDDFIAAIDGFEKDIRAPKLSSSIITHHEEEAQPTPPSKTKFRALFGGLLKPNQSLNGQKLRTELTSFLSIHPLQDDEISEKFDLLKWWSDREAIYPLLSSIAKKLFSILASAATCESLFSTTGHVVTDIRSSIAPQNVDMLVFLYVNTPESFYAIPHD